MSTTVTDDVSYTTLPDCLSKAASGVRDSLLSQCVLFNARSLRNKLSELQAIMSVKRISLAFVTESWLDCSITDSLIDPSADYSIYRHDRAMRVGGGVLAMVSKQLHSYQIAIPKQFQLVEVECFEVVVDHSVHRFIVLYRPPEFNAVGRDYSKRMLECLSYLCNTNNSVLIVGDLNLPDVDWFANTAPDDDIQLLFLNFCNDYGFSQYVSEPTRGNNVLDLVLCNNPYTVSCINVIEPFSNSDHSMIEFNLVLKAHEHSKAEVTTYDFCNADVDAIADALSQHPFNYFTPTGSTDDVWSQFIDPIFKTIHDHVPVKTRRTSGGTSRHTHYPRHIVRALHKKSLLWRKYRRNKTVDNKVAYTEQAENCKSLIFDYECSRESELINKSNLGAFYRFINKRLSTKSGVGPLRPAAGCDVIETDDSKKASMLNAYFSSVFVPDDGSLPEFPSRVSQDTFVNNIEITAHRVLYFINKCKTGTAPGPDGIPVQFLKQFKFPLLQPLVVLYRYLMDCGQIPSQWKLADVTPVFKKGLASDVCNYRPISLTSVFSKMFERIIHEQMIDYLLRNGLISSHQHGFLVKHSTCSQLLETVNDWSIALKNCNIVDIVYFDIAKAFDTVSHVKLIYKLQAYGVHGSLLSLIANFLDGRSQRVKLPGGASTWKPVLSGVPQGSVLGPLLFLLYINDVSDLFHDNVSIKLFADDIKIYMEIENNSQTVIFQEYINVVSDWADKWQLKLSYSKCHHLRVSLRKFDAPAGYLLNNVPLSRVLSCNDLGVRMNSVLSFSEHINNVVVKAKQRTSLLLRSFLSKDPTLLTRAFIVYVRPMLEYCSPVWSPCSIGNINKLESVQRSFTKRLSGMRSLSYEGRLKALGLERLELRRLRIDLITCYNVIHGCVSIPFESFFEFSTHRSTRGHPFKLFYPDPRVNVRAHCFPIRVISLWNRLPTSIVLAENTQIFKKLLKHVDFSYAMFGET